MFNSPIWKLLKQYAQLVCLYSLIETAISHWPSLQQNKSCSNEIRVLTQVTEPIGQCQWVAGANNVVDET